MSERNLRKTRVGKVVSDKMDKTVVVAIEDNVKHPLLFYEGFFRSFQFTSLKR